MPSLLSSADEDPESTPDPPADRPVQKHLLSNTVFVTASPGSTVNLYSAVGAQFNSRTTAPEPADTAPWPNSRQSVDHGADDHRIAEPLHWFSGRWTIRWRWIVVILPMVLIGLSYLRYVQGLAALKL
jgi:hypothetical protein